MISRARKIEEVLQLDIYGCNAIGQSTVADTTREDLNRSIGFHIRLMQCVIREFRDLRASHEFYLIILLIGGGSLMCVGVKEILISQSIVYKLVVFVIVHCLNIGWSVLYSIFTEIRVSNEIVSENILLKVIYLRF